MITNRDLVQKTKPLLKDSYLQVFACILLASILPQILLSVSPQSILLNIVVTCLSAYLQVGIALYCIEIYRSLQEMVVRVEIVWLIFGSNLFCICKEFVQASQ